ncbi:histidine utilization repressor [Pseudomonas sp. 008]|nr:histidine utilization repressor [Pseudomonas sp. 008]
MPKQMRNFPSRVDQLSELPAPRYAQVKQMITQLIMSGTWSAHERIPSESDLAQELGLSRLTINRALSELTADGVLVRTQGVGTFVAERKGQSALFAVNNIADEISERDHRHHCKVILLCEEWAGADQVLALNMREGQRVFHSLIVHYENDMAVQLEDRYVNAAVAPDYLRQDFVMQTPYAYLSRVAPLTEGEHVVEAILAEEEDCRLLQIKRDEACLLIRRRTWSGHQSVTSARLILPGSRHRLEGRFGS